MSEKNSNSQFNAYEYIGIIAPGAILSLGMIIMWPSVKDIFFNENFTVGELGLFIIISYVVGHLLQSVGNLIEKIIWWFFGGMPTNWVLSHEQTLISSQQRDKLKAKIRHSQNCQNFEGIDKNTWYSITREMYIEIEKAGRSGRIDSFNRSYGLLRGITAGFFVLAVAIPIQSLENYKASLWILGFGFFPAIVRMFRFGKIYGREVIIEYIKL